MIQRHHQVLVVGGGHAGVRAARTLLDRQRPGEVDVALASRDNVELWHGLMPQVLSGALQPQHALVPLREVLPNGRIYNQEILKLDLGARTALLSSGVEGQEIEIAYDYLVIAVGSILDVSRFPGLAEHSLPTKTIGDFFQLRNHVIRSLEVANEHPDQRERERLLTFVVAGAGFGGVEVASETMDLVRRQLPLYRNLSLGDIRVICVDISKRVLPTVPEELSARAAEYMQRIGIELRLGVGVASATATDVTLTDGTRIETRSVIATAGTGPNPLIANIGVEVKRGRITCDNNARVVGQERTYAAGDVAAISDASGNPYPPLVTFAIAEGDLAGRNVLHEIRGEPLEEFRHAAVAQVGILTRSFGVAQMRGRFVHGRPAALLGKWTFLSFMPSWRRRARLALDWTISRTLGSDVSNLEVSGSDAVRRMRFNAGDQVIRAGDVGRYFYVITDGSVEVVDGPDGEERVLRTLGPGDHFGELALMEETGRRTAAVRAVTDTRVIALDREDFATLVGAMPGLVKQG